MASPKQLLSVVESTLLGSAAPSPSQRIELLHAIRNFSSSFRSLLSYPSPKLSDRTEVLSKEVRLPDSHPISLDDQDVQIALKLSDDLHLNEIDCVQLIVSANQERGLMGRDPLEILRLAAGIWYTERRDLLTALYTLLRAVVLDQGLEVNLVADIQKYLEELIHFGLRQRFITLIRELNREEPAGLGGPNSEHFVIDSRGALVERRAVVCRERLILGHCLVLSVLVVRTSPNDITNAFSALKESAADLNCNSSNTLKHQITYSLLFSLVVAFISDALGVLPDHKSSILSCDASFRREFKDIVMATGDDSAVQGFVDCVRLAWCVHLMLIQDGIPSRGTISSAPMNDIQSICLCLDAILSNNVFQFLVDRVLRTAAYQNDDEDMIYMYNAYLHKLITCFLSQPIVKDEIKGIKEKAMSVLSPYHMAGPHDTVRGGSMDPQQATEAGSHTFVSLMEFVSEIYEKEPQLLSGDDSLWAFINFAGEDHTNVETLVAFLKMLSTLASSEEGALKVFELLQGKTFQSIRWSTLFDCLSIYEERFKQSLQDSGAMLPDFQEGDARALVAYLNVLQKVVENGNPIERKNWFADIEPLFKLLSYESVPPYLKGALRNTIATFVRVSHVLKDAIWSYLERYDLPVVVGPLVQNGVQPMSAQVYDMQFELNEIEARRELYPSTISFINLLNALIADERDVHDRGRRFIGIFKFIYNHVFGPFPQRAYADPCEKWRLAVACLQHFHMILSMYSVDVEDIIDRDELVSVGQSTPLQMRLPVIELLKDFMSGKTVLRNIMGIITPGVNTLITERTSQIFGQHLEKAVQLCLEIIVLVLEKDMILSDSWRPVYQPLDVILSQDQNHIVALLEYARYDFCPRIQQCSIKIMSILSSRMVGLVQLLLKSNSAKSLIEDYAACLELRSEESQIIENSGDDPGVLIMQLLIDNISRPAPNVTHLLLMFDVDARIEQTALQPKFHYSCLKVILDMIGNHLKPDVNALLHEFGLQLFYELCLDPLTNGPIMVLLSNKKYQFFVNHLDMIGMAPLPKRNVNQALRISSLHQRAWLLKLLAVELHAGDMANSTHREACRNILVHLFGFNSVEPGFERSSSYTLQNDTECTGAWTLGKNKVLGLLEVVQFRSPDTAMEYSQAISSAKYNLLVDDILGDPSAVRNGGIYYYTERGDRLIDLAAFRDKLWLKFNPLISQLSSGSEADLNVVKETVQQLLRWGWKYNRNLEEQAAQLHMLTGWSRIVEVSASRRMSFLKNQSDILFLLLDSSLTASASPDCSLRMALILTQVALTCMAKLRDERFFCPSGLTSDNATYLDILLAKRLSNGSCRSILLKLVMAILRNESSETLRRRQYALLLSYFQYCQHVLNLDIPIPVLQFLLHDEPYGDDLDLFKIDKEQEELAQANFVILRKEAHTVLNLVITDATKGSESGKTMALYVIDALIGIDHERFFLGQLQSRGFLRSCIASISDLSFLDGSRSLESLQRACFIEAGFSLLLKICYKYGKAGTQVLFSMGVLDHIASCKVGFFQGSLCRIEPKLRKDVYADFDKQRMIIVPILRLVFSATSLIHTSEFFEVKNKVVREIIDLVKSHHSLFIHALQVNFPNTDELMMEHVNLVVGILTKVWPYEEVDDHGFVQGLLGMMCTVFSCNLELLSFSPSAKSIQSHKKSELHNFRLCFSLSSYLYFLVTRSSLRLQVSEGSFSQQQPSLTLLSHFLGTVAAALARAADEKSLLLSKVQDITELSRQEVDEIINMCDRQDLVSSSESIQKRRNIAMVEMCQIAGNRHQLITLLLQLAEIILNVMYLHFQDGFVEPETRETMKMVTRGRQADEALLCENMVPALEQLELLAEDKTGCDLKVFERLVRSVKEMAIQKLASYLP